MNGMALRWKLGLPAVVAALMVLSGCTSDVLQTVAPQSPTERVIGAGNGASDYKLMVGDKVKVTLFDVTTESAEYTVDQAGSITVPPLEPITVTGLTAKDASEIIATSFQQAGLLRTPRITLDVVNYGPIYVLGEVTKPGELVYRPGMSLLAAVAAAGGYTYRADRSRVLIRRMHDPLETEYTLRSDIVIMPGDVVRVPEIHF